MKFKELKNNALLSKGKSDAELENIYQIVSAAFENLELVNTDDIEPADFPFELQRSFLREDIPDMDIKKDFAKNIAVDKKNFIVIKGVRDE